MKNQQFKREKKKVWRFDEIISLLCEGKQLQFHVQLLLSLNMMKFIVMLL